MNTFDHRYAAVCDRLKLAGGNVWALHYRAAARLAAGEDIHMLSVGDPDLPTQSSTIRAAIEALEKGRTHYSPGRGEPHLRRTIADIETRASGKPCDPDQVVIFPGATNAIYSVLSCLLNPGDGLVVVEPMYIGYQGAFQVLDVDLATVPLDVEQGFIFRADWLRDAVTEHTRAVLLNTPGNPAGNIIREDDLRDLARFCRERDVWLVCDEVYSMITFEKRHVSLRRAAAELDNVVIVDSFSKSHAMTGWRLGWSVSPRQLADHLVAFNSSTVFGCSQFVQDAGAFALINDEEYIDSVRQEYRRRRDHVCERIETIPGISCHVPEAGMFLMVNVAATGLNGLSFADNLLDDQGVSVMPGDGFGACTADYVRLSLGLSIDNLDAALDRIETFCRSRTTEKREG